MANHLYKNGEMIFQKMIDIPPPGDYTVKYDPDAFKRQLYEDCSNFNDAIISSIMEITPRNLVQAQFTPGGKKYTYNCPGAEIGDTITGPGATGPAKVVALGSTGYTGPFKTATILQKGNIMGTGVKSTAQFNQYTLEVREGESISKALRRALKKARKAEAREKELREKKQAEIAERDRRRVVALEALERNANNGDTQAAVELLNS